MDKYWEKAKSPLERNERVREYLSEGRKIRKKKRKTSKMSRSKGEKKVRQTNRKKRKKKIVSR